MKHLLVLSSLCILLLASCTKQELILPEMENNATPNQATELSKGDLTFNQIKSNYIKDDTPIFYHYFLDGERVENGSIDINDQGLFVQLVAKSGMKKGKEVLNYEFHAYTDQYEFVTWAAENHMLTKDAFDITNTLSMYPNSEEVRQKFELTGELPVYYKDYVSSVVDGAMMARLGNVEIAPRSFVFFRNTLNDGGITKANDDCMPLFSDEWNNQITALQGNNLYLPTLLFEDDFYQNRMNPVIFNKSSRPIIFEGPLEDLKGRVSSVF